MIPRPERGRAFRGLARPGERGRTQLICLPFAGGGANAFDSWTPLVERHLDVHVARLPGRGERFDEPLPERLLDLVEELADELTPRLGEDVVLFGHSMGAMLALELARELGHRRGIRLGCLVLSGRPGPGAVRSPLHVLDDTELAEAMHGLGGTDRRIVEHTGLWEVLAPILRADLAMVEHHRLTASPVLACPVLAYGAERDPDTTPDLLARWRVVTTGRFETRIFPGDHFYFHSHPEALATDLLQRFVPSLP
ncbi:thioesterase II family protein [Streptomyces hygroscopicus]|uniref:thioesterase II family protein n=1 Tax=Streptomyces hygroscopicus TaxID=1912 RepID=UPI0036CCA2DB